MIDEEKIASGIMLLADHFWIESQKRQLIEEMAELTQAICKLDRAASGAPLAPELTESKLMGNVIEEIADVQLVLMQVAYLLDCGNRVQEITQEKINRTIERIESGRS